MPQKIGLESTIDNKGLHRGVSEYLGGINKMQSQTAGVASSISSTFSKIGSSAANSAGGLSKLASGLGGIATVMAGNVLATGFENLASGVMSFVGAGVQAVSHAQVMEASLGALLTQNNLYEQSTKTVSVAVGDWAKEQENAAAKSADLAFEQRKLTADINTQNASIQEQRQRIIQMADGLDKNQQVARLAEMEIALEGMQRELVATGTEQGKLNNLTQEYATITQTSWEQVMNMADAQGLAKKQTQELLSFVEKLSIISPFEQESVELVTKYAVGAGLGVDATKQFTAAFLDWSAAVGITSVNLDDAAYQLLQVKKIGSISQVDLKQLAGVGLDLAKVIGVEMGMSIEEFNAEAKKSPAIFDELINAIVSYSKNTFAGTSEAMSTSLEGMRSTMSDLFTQSAKKILRPLVDAATPAMVAMVGKMTDFITGGGLAKIGEQIPKILFGAFESLSGGGEGGLFSGLKGLGLSSSVAKEVTEVTRILGEMGARISEAFAGGGIQGAFAEFGVILGEVWASTIQPQLMEWGNQFWGWLTTTVIPLAQQKLSELATTIAGFFRDNWPIVQAQLTEWGNQFWTWVSANVIPQIPAKLTEALNAVAAFLRDNWPTIQASLNEWAGKFFGWVGEVAATIGEKMAPLLDSFITWVTSPETQTKLNEVGTNIINSVFTGVTTAASNVDELAKIATNIAEGLGVAVVAVTGTLILVGASIVAGIYSGILEHLGIDLQPATIQELGTILKNIGNDIVTIAKHVGTKIVNAINDGLIAALQTGMKIGEHLRKAIEEGRETLDDWQQLGTDAIDGLLEGMKARAGDVLEFLKNLAGDSLSGLGQFWGAKSPAKKFIPLGESVPQGLTVGVQNAAGGLNKELKGLGQSAINSLMTGMSVNDTGFKDSLIDDLDMGGIASSLGRRGTGWKELRRIIGNTIKGNMHVLEDGGDPATIMGLIQREAARFNFPPQFAAELAKAEGLIGHLTDTFKEKWTAMRVENLKGSASLASQFASIGQSFADMINRQVDAFGESKAEVNKLNEASTKLSGTMQDQQAKMAILQQELTELTSAQELDTIAIDKKKLAIEELTEKMAENQGAIDKNKQAMADYRKELENKAFSKLSDFATFDDKLQSDLATIELLNEFIADTKDQLVLTSNFDTVYGQLTSSITYDRIAAQEELNRLLTEQAKREQDILNLQKSQQQLEFLQQQISLLDMLQSRGIDPASILGGMTLGINASASDLLAATSAVVQAMVGQINQDLQIHSPSKVMVGIGKNIVGSLAKTIGAGKGMLAGAMGGISGAVMRPFSGGADNRNYSRTNSMNVTINNPTRPSQTANDIMMLRARTARI